MIITYIQKRRKTFGHTGLQPRNRDGIAVPPLPYDKIHRVVTDGASMIVNIDNIS